MQALSFVQIYEIATFLNGNVNQAQFFKRGVGPKFNFYVDCDQSTFYMKLQLNRIMHICTTLLGTRNLKVCSDISSARKIGQR